MAQGKVVKGLPTKALEVLRWVLEFHRRAGYMPTLREAAAGLGMASHYSVRYYINILAARGYVVRSHGTARTLRVTPTGYKAAG